MFKREWVEGDFERDADGQPILLTNEAGELVDRAGRLVNSHGLLVDETGNVLSPSGHIMFKRE